MMMRVVVNPSSASGRAWSRLQAAGLLTARNDVEWIESRSAAHVSVLVHDAQRDRLDTIVVAGGDGTVSAALAGLDATLSLGILPLGSGNDFARDCGIPSDLRLAFAALPSSHRRRVDVACCVSTTSRRRFCCVAAVGLDEAALRIIYASRLRRSRALHLYAAVRALVSYRPRKVRITWASGVFEGDVLFAAVTNTRSYGGGFCVSPSARLDDGAVDLCIVTPTSRARLLAHFPRVLRGTHVGLPEVVTAQSTWVRIESLGKDELDVPLDGELGLARTPVELRCEPNAVDIVGCVA